MALDVVCLVVPFATGSGVLKATVKAANAIDNVLDVAKTVNRADNIIDIAKTAGKIADNADEIVDGIKIITNVIDATGDWAKGIKNTKVYLGITADGVKYVGISNDVLRRQAQHGKRFINGLQAITPDLSRNEARAIEQAIINIRPGYQNIRNSISIFNSWYDDAIEWANKLLGLG